MNPAFSHYGVRPLAVHAAFFVLAMLLAGCGTSGIYAVRGQIVDKNGNPVETLKGGAIAFEHLDKKGGAHGTIDEKGRFTLSTERPGDGAYEGKHKVVITRPRGASPEMPNPPVVALKYESSTTTDLFVMVEPRSNDLKLEVELAKK
jgi:hypothetical protein